MADVELVLSAITLALGVGAGAMSILILKRLKNENTEVSWRYLIASAVVFALAQVFSLLKLLEIRGLESILLYQPEAAYLLFSILFVLGVSRQHQVVRNSDLD